MRPRSASPYTATERSRALLRTTGGQCAALADRIYDDMIQELSGLSLSLSAARDDDGLADEERDTLCTQARAIEQCCRLLSGVLERLAGMDTPPEAAAGSAGREVSAGSSE